MSPSSPAPRSVSGDPGRTLRPKAASDQRPPHLQPALLLLVLAGGTAGTAAREALSLLLPRTGAIPLTTLGINLLGAFLLGILLEGLARRGPEDPGRRRRLRLLLGTGFLGGFTTYSALSTATAQLLGAGDVGPAMAYALGTVLLGGVMTGCGIAAASFVRPAAAEASR